MESDTSAIIKHEINFDFVAKNINRFKKSIISPSNTLYFLSWRIRIKPIFEGSSKTASRYKLYLICDGEAESFGCCNIIAELTAVSYYAENVVRETRDVVYAKNSKWRTNYLMLQCKDIYPKWAYIPNNTITLKAHITAEYTPQGIDWEQVRFTPMESVLSQSNAKCEATFNFVVENFSEVKKPIFSAQHIIRNLPWRIRIGPESENFSDPNSTKWLAFYVKCDADPENLFWNCSAKGELTVVSRKAGVQNVIKNVAKVFSSLSNTWGLRKFMTWNDLLNPKSGFIVNDTVIFQAHIIAEKPEGISCGYTGLKNQVTKSYMNSLLQTLFFTDELRKAIYKMPTENDESRSLLLAMQRVFFDLQTESTVVDAQYFSRSLYCEALDLYSPHDLRKFVQLLFEKLECGMKCTPVEGTISKLFRGKMKSFIMLNNVKYVTEKPETFYNIELNVTEKKNINEAFREYMPIDLNASESNIQNAKSGVLFESFPPVLHIHLMRFHHDNLTDCCIKFNDRFEFYEKLNLNSYLQRLEPTPAIYTLHAVLAHGGDYDGDQYVAYIDRKCDGKWCKFADENVSPCSKKDAVENNYGGQVVNSTNAYMLVYIRDSELKNVLTDVTENDIPNELKARLEEERKTTKIIEFDNDYVTINVFREKSPDTQQYNVKQLPIRIFKIKSTNTVEQVLTLLSKSFNRPLNQIKIQPFNLNANQTYTSINFDINAEKNNQIGNVVKSIVWNVFLVLP